MDGESFILKVYHHLHKCDPVDVEFLPSSSTYMRLQFEEGVSEGGVSEG